MNRNKEIASRKDTADLGGYERSKKPPVNHLKVSKDDDARERERFVI